MADERAPLLTRKQSSRQRGIDAHEQFCKLSGIPYSNLPHGTKAPPVGKRTLYGRASAQHSSAKWSYNFMAVTSNALLLSQVMLGAALTGLGASESSHILITVFGAMNTVIAGLVAYLKSRGQPMRARMYCDDLERVLDEMENSEIMWLGISEGIHGYDDIDTDDKVTVRSEVGRLTRLYERAIRNNTMNNPDNYLMGASDGTSGTALRPRPVGVPAIPAPAAPAPMPISAAPSAAVPGLPLAHSIDPDESPATAVPFKPTPPSPPEPPKQEVKPDPAPPKDSAPTTSSPATNVPVTNAPSTNAPVTSAPADNAPTNDVPTTSAPTDNAPANGTEPAKVPSDSDTKPSNDVPKDNETTKVLTPPPPEATTQNEPRMDDKPTNDQTPTL